MRGLKLYNLIGGRSANSSGEVYSEILMFERSDESWLRASHMRRPRYDHAVSSVTLDADWQMQLQENCVEDLYTVLHVSSAARHCSTLSMLITIIKFISF